MVQGLWVDVLAMEEGGGGGGEIEEQRAIPVVKVTRSIHSINTEKLFCYIPTCI